MTLTKIQDALHNHGLFVMGHDQGRVLIGTDAQWWEVFQDSDEYRDRASNPVDRWSKRVIGGLADAWEARAHFPSDGPPYAPFIAWALATGRFWQSPTGMMIHDHAGLMISIRGALEFDSPFPAHSGGPSPCETCVDTPCVSACPVEALSARHPYDVPACKSYLDTPNGGACMTRGCHVRRACPISAAFGRPEAQTAFHMQAFRG